MGATIEQDGFSISSSDETEDAMRAALEPVAESVDATAAAAADADAAKIAADAAAKPDAATKPAAKVAKPRNDPQARIDQATERQRTAERDLAAERAARTRLEGELAEARRAKPAGEPVKPAEKESPKAEWERYKAMADAPQLAMFEDFGDWTVAMNLFIADKRYDERALVDAQEHAARSRHETWLTKLADARKKDPTYDSRLNPNTPATQYMREFIADSPIGPDLLMHLSDHQDLAQRLTTLHPLKIAEELGRLEGELSSRQAAAHSGPALAPAISAAKPVIKPVTGSPIVSDDAEDEGELPIEEFVKRGNARERHTPAARH